MLSLPISRAQIEAAKLPIIYTEAVTALAACVTLDEAKYWSDKSEALAAWAKIYRSKQAAMEARRLKLHAFRRMGELAMELRPKMGSSYKRGNPGPSNLLQSHGIVNNNSIIALKLAKLSKKEFEGMINSPRPPAPSKVFASRSTMSEMYGEFSAVLQPLRTFMRKTDPREFARKLEESEVRRLQHLLPDLLEWLDTLDQHLPKSRV